MEEGQVWVLQLQPFSPGSASLKALWPVTSLGQLLPFSSFPGFLALAHGRRACLCLISSLQTAFFAAGTKDFNYEEEKKQHHFEPEGRQWAVIQLRLRPKWAISCICFTGSWGRKWSMLVFGSQFGGGSKWHWPQTIQTHRASPVHWQNVELFFFTFKKGVMKKTGKIHSSSRDPRSMKVMS